VLRGSSWRSQLGSTEHVHAVQMAVLSAGATRRLSTHRRMSSEAQHTTSCSVLAHPGNPRTVPPSLVTMLDAWSSDSFDVIAWGQYRLGHWSLELEMYMRWHMDPWGSSGSRKRAQARGQKIGLRDKTTARRTLRPAASASRTMFSVPISPILPSCTPPRRLF
jgi:hypothetical protein